MGLCGAGLFIINRLFFSGAPRRSPTAVKVCLPKAVLQSKILYGVSHPVTALPCHPSLRKGLFRDLTLGRGRTQGRPCHPERSIAKSNCEAVRRRSRAGSRAGTESFHRRSRCYASPCGFDYGGDSHRLPTASAQDDTHGDTSSR